MPSQQRSSLSQKAAAAAFWGFKAFLTMEAFPVTGCIELLVNIGTQLLAEGVSALARRTHQALGPSTSNNNSSNNNNPQHADAAHNHDTYAGAVANMVYAYGSVERFQREVTNFAQFSRQLSTQLTLHGDATSGDAMATAERVYLQFVECDLDGSGDISIEEFVVFCSKMGVSEESAMAKFFRADVNGDGKISFEEWTAMMMGRVGRAESGLNCGGHHGLTRYTAPISGISCNFCRDLIAVGSLASGCRRCNCDACPSCSGLSQSRPSAPPSSFEGSTRRTAPSLQSAVVANDLKCQCSHGLQPFVTRAETPCTWCRTLILPGNPAVGCWACGMYSCMECVAVSLETRCASVLNCRGRHGLAKTQIMTGGYACDFCRTVLAGGTTIYGCRMCGVASCVTCMWKDHRRALSSASGALSCPGNHQLRTMRVFGYQQLGHTCKWCLRAPSLHEHILRCHVCDVNVCNACQASGVAQRVPPAPASTPRLPLPPPSYDEFKTNGNRQGGAPAPLLRILPADAGSAHTPISAHFPEQKQRRIVAAEAPFPFDSVVRVLSIEEDDPHGKLMTVIGFEPSGKCPDEDGGGEVVLNFRGNVVRAPSFLVSKLDDIQ